MGQYYALCMENENGESEIAFLHLEDDEELGQILGISIYTSPDGVLQQQHLRTYVGTDDAVTIAPVSHEDLLDAMDRGYPSSVFVDGRKLAGSVFKGLLKTELGLPIKHPRLVKLEDPEPE